MTKLLNVKQVAELLAVGTSVVYELAAAGEIGHVRVGGPKKRGALRFTEAHVLAFLARREKKPGEAVTPPPETLKPTRKLRHLSLD